jgi:hypothetical protein
MKLQFHLAESLVISNTFLYYLVFSSADFKILVIIVLLLSLQRSKSLPLWNCGR